MCAYATNEKGTSYGEDKTLTTLANPVGVTRVTLNKETTTLTVGESEQLIAMVLPESASDKRVTWSVLNESETGVLTAANGLVSAMKAGTAVVRATSGSNSEAYAECTVTVNPAPQAVLTGITISPKPISLTVGATKQVTVTASYSDQTTAEVTAQCGFEFSTSGIASINNSGLLTGGSVGITVLTASFGEKQDTVEITVTAAAPGGGGGSSSGGGSSQKEPANPPVEPKVEAPAAEPADLSGHWAHDCIMALLQHGIIKGYPDLTIRPENEITRAEAAALLVSALGLQDFQLQNGDSPYQDELPAWAKKAILIAVDAGQAGSPTQTPENQGTGAAGSTNPGTEESGVSSAGSGEQSNNPSQPVQPIIAAAANEQTETKAEEPLPILLQQEPSPIKVTASVSDSTVTMGAGFRNVLAGDSTWGINITGGTLKGSLGDELTADIIVNGLPQGLNWAAKNAGTNNILITVSGPASPLVTEPAAVSVTVKGSAVSETEANDSDALTVSVNLSGPTPGAIAIDAANSSIYVLNRERREVTVIDSATDSIKCVFSGGRGYSATGTGGSGANEYFIARRLLSMIG